MRFVPTRIHGIVDWLLGALLSALPWLLGFARGGPETYVPVALGSIGLLRQRADGRSPGTVLVTKPAASSVTPRTRCGSQTVSTNPRTHGETARAAPAKASIAKCPLMGMRRTIPYS